MTKSNIKPHSTLAVWLDRFQQRSPCLFAAGILTVASILMAVQYSFGEWAYHPDVQLWKEPAFWSGIPRYAVLPLALWFGWMVISIGRLKTLQFIFGLAIVICAGDVILHAVPNVLRSIEKLHYHQFKPPLDKWHWQTYWYWLAFGMPTVFVIGNLILLRRWWRLFAPKFSSWKLTAAKETTKGSVVLKSFAIIAAYAAFLLTAIHLALPRISINDTTTSLAQTFLVQSRLKADFEYLIANPTCRGKRLGAILDHLELADLQRQQFYADLDEPTFRQFILSPSIDGLPLNEVDWRRTLWENFYPRVRHENDPIAAAQIVVRFLRERIGIDPSYHYRVGMETIWTQQMTDEPGFERIYVAALRSVGIAAWLDEQDKAELWTGKEWQAAPKPPVLSFSSLK